VSKPQEYDLRTFGNGRRALESGGYGKHLATRSCKRAGMFEVEGLHGGDFVALSVAFYSGCLQRLFVCLGATFGGLLSCLAYTTSSSMAFGVWIRESERDARVSNVLHGARFWCLVDFQSPFPYANM
jgi:hypothetical protein